MPSLITRFFLTDQVPGCDDDLVLASGQTGGLYKVYPKVRMPEGFIIPPEGLCRNILVSTHGVSQQGVILIEEDRNLGLWLVISDNVPVGLNKTVILRSLDHSFSS